MATGEFSFRVSERPDEVSIVVAGSIDETSELVPPPARGRRVVIDAEQVQRINSLGVRAWIVMMESLAAETHDVVVRNLPAVLVTQASMISTFLGNARVESFKTPWICMSCETSLEQLYGASDPVPQNIQCPSCGQAMELDWDRASYLAFRGGR
jgi:anti-anti-sigma regulatory factor